MQSPPQHSKRRAWTPPAAVRGGGSWALAGALGLGLGLGACSGPRVDATTGSTSAPATGSAGEATGESTGDATGEATRAATGEASESDATTAADACAGGPEALYADKIAPLLAGDRPKTCNTCHLSGVDLGVYVQDSPCRTMACLGAKELVDLDDPKSSVILQWILRADPASPLIDQQIIDAEHAAFLAWIEATAACGYCYTGDDPCGGGPMASQCPDDDPKAGPYFDDGSCDPRTREALFRHKVYAWRDRCYPCHFDDNTKVEAPKWVATGPCEVGSLMTMHNVFDLGLVDLEAPTQSLLLRKPLSEAEGGVMHGGHDKFADAKDPAYVDFLAWIEREAACEAAASGGE